MTPAWYDQQAAASSRSSQQAPANNSMQHPNSYHHANIPPPGGVMGQHGSGASYHRSSPPMMSRPPSSASTSSASSYHTAGTIPGPGPAPRSHQFMHGPPGGGGGPRSHAPHGHHGPSHQHMHGGGSGPGGGIRPLGGAPRYPMPPRNGALQQHRPISGGGAFGPFRQHQLHGPPVGSMGGRHEGGGGQPLRPIPRGANALQGLPPHNHHHHNGSHPKPPTSALLRSGHPNMHHPVPFRRGPLAHPMGLPGGNGSGGGAFQPANTSHPQRPGFLHHQQHQNEQHPAPHPADAMNSNKQEHHRHHRQYGSPGMDPSISRSPSPPPAPPGFLNGNPSPPVLASPGRLVAESTVSTLGPLRERRNDNVQERKTPQKPTPQKPPAADMTADAASILLELRTVMTQANKNEQGENVGDQENVQGDKPSTKEQQALEEQERDVKMIEESGSSDEDASHSSPPDLTSEPSSDTADVQEPPMMVPENFPTRLALAHDDAKLNSLHCFLRSELLEIFVVRKSQSKSPTHSPGSSVGRVGLRCVHCAISRKQRNDRDEAPMAVFYPKSIAEIYRLVTSWQRCHLRKCRSLPPPVRSTWQSLRENDKSRGKTHYWVTSAKEIGLVDCQSRAGGVRFGPEAIKRFLKAAGDNNTTAITSEDASGMADEPTEDDFAAPPTEVETATLATSSALPPTLDETKVTSSGATTDAKPTPTQPTEIVTAMAHGVATAVAAV